MTEEEINQKIDELKKKKKLILQKENQKKRKLENRVKYIIGGANLKSNPDCVKNLLTKGKDLLRPQDIKILQEYLNSRS